MAFVPDLQALTAPASNTIFQWSSPQSLYQSSSSTPPNLITSQSYSHYPCPDPLHPVCIDGYGGSPNGTCSKCHPGWAGAGLSINQPCRPCNATASDYSMSAGSSACSTCPASQVANKNRTGCSECCLMRFDWCLTDFDLPWFGLLCFALAWVGPMGLAPGMQRMPHRPGRQQEQGWVQ